MTNAVQTSSRKRLMYAGIIAAFLVLLVRLAQLQVVYQDVYGKKSEQNSIRTIVRDPIRGYIFDHAGKLIVDNRPAYTVTITPAEFSTGNVEYLANILGVNKEFILERLRKGRSHNRFAPIKVKRDVDFQVLSILEENRHRLPGVDYLVESKRYYPTKAKAPHLFGYVKEISEKQLAELGEPYRQGDVIGAAGIEAAYETYLAGKKGFEFITVNAKGQLLGAYNDGRSDIPSQEGDDLYLTLVGELQAFAESLMANRHGAIVALDPSTGGVLALVSKPDFDPMIFSGVTTAEQWTALNTDPGKPLFNRATLTRYPPGSAFKMVLAAAALQEGIVSPGWRVQCTGGYKFGNRVFKDLHVHGSTDVVEALQKSCNVFFYTLMMRTGLNAWSQYGREFGFGAPTGIDIVEENPGLLPSVQYYDRVYGKGKWTQGYLVSLGIGQGELGVSPVQMAAYAMVLANKGQYHQPYVVSRIRRKTTGVFEYTQPQTRTLPINNDIWELIRRGMYLCVSAPGGTGRAAQVRGIAVAGKTGTAENPHGQDHAWFVGFAPYENPRIAICVLVENAGFGGAVAAPIASLIMEKYLHGEIIRHKPEPALAATAAIR